MAADSLKSELIESQKAKVRGEIENIGLAAALTANHLCTTALEVIIQRLQVRDGHCIFRFNPL